MKVREVMTTPVLTVEPAACFDDIVDLLIEHDVSGVPVVDEAGRLLGVVTEADLTANAAYDSRRRSGLAVLADYVRGRDLSWVDKVAACTARELMTSPVDSAAPDDDIGAVARRMLTLRHKRLPVLEDGRLVGIIARHDVLAHFHRPDEHVAAEIRDLLLDVRRAPEGHGATASVAAGVVRLEGTVPWPSDVALLEALVSRIPGVVAVVNRLQPLQPQPVPH